MISLNANYTVNVPDESGRIINAGKYEDVIENYPQYKNEILKLVEAQKSAEAAQRLAEEEAARIAAEKAASEE